MGHVQQLNAALHVIQLALVVEPFLAEVGEVTPEFDAFLPTIVFKLLDFTLKGVLVGPLLEMPSLEFVEVQPSAFKLLLDLVEQVLVDGPAFGDETVDLVDDGTDVVALVLKQDLQGFEVVVCPRFR